MTKFSDISHVMDMTALMQRVAREDMELIREFLAKPIAERRSVYKDFRVWFRGFTSLRELEWVSAREFVIPRYKKYLDDPGAVLANSNQRYEAMQDLANQIDDILSASVADDKLLTRLLQKYIETLSINFEFEEAIFIPMILEHYDPVERHQAEVAYIRRVGLRAITFELTWILLRASPEERQAVLGRMPGVARLLYKYVWEPRHLKHFPAFARVKLKTA